MARRYEPWTEKHKAPRGFGSLCPVLPDGVSQRLLNTAIPHATSLGDRLYAVVGEWCFAAAATDAARGVYHGYPLAGIEVPPVVLRELEERGDITHAQRMRLMRQASVPRLPPEV